MSRADSRVRLGIRAGDHSLYTMGGPPYCAEPRLVSFTSYSVNFVKWSSQGMLRMSCEAMNELFQPTVSGIIQHIGECLDAPLILRLGVRNNPSHLCL